MFSGVRALEPHRVDADVEDVAAKRKPCGQRIDQEVEQRKRRDTRESPQKSFARTGEMRPCGIGRRIVRAITRSMSASKTQLSAPAEPAASAPPSSVQNVSASGGMPRAAITIAAAVVINSSTMMRGLASS